MAFAPALSLGFSAISGIMGAVGSITQGIAGANAANYQAAVARNNAIIATQNAQYAASAGGVQAQNQDTKTRAIIGATEAAQGASGIDTATGSPLQVRESEAQVGRLDSATIMANAMQQSRAFQAQATNQTAQAELDTMQARNASTAGLIGAGSSLIGGASSFSDKWLRYQTEGVKVF